MAKNTKASDFKRCRYKANRDLEYCGLLEGLSPALALCFTIFHVCDGARKRQSNKDQPVHVETGRTQGTKAKLFRLAVNSRYSLEH